MYHLTCPSCQDVTDSPFVRSGAVVRCPACEHKYRIKSAHFQREVHTGPRTLDETDSVLRSDSVDIDPDEVSPVSIDDEGNVVGLSGLSELMRWSDNQDQSQVTGTPSPTRSKGKQGQATQGELPQAKPAKTKSGGKAKAAAPKSKPGKGRARAQALKRKKRNQMYILLGSVGAAVILLAIIVPALLPEKTPTTETGPDQDKPDETVVDNNPSGTEPGPKPDGGTPDPEVPDEVRVFSEHYTPSPNPVLTFQPPWNEPDTSLPPRDVPTVLTPAEHLTHEDWYVMNPPRGSADASGVSNVELGQITASSLPNNQTLLAGSVANNTDQAVARGELHIMLLDSTGNVFAETFTPLAMIEPSSKQPISLTIPTRYWKRSRGVRAGVQVDAWSDPVAAAQGIELAHTSLGASSAVRVSLKHTGDRPLRGIKMLLSATDSRGSAVANFLVEENSLYIARDQWLDLVIATPLQDGREVAEWATLLQTK
ncbi:MAG: hypothetical protein KTR15_16140 [Phycisphaeraceae bacterium]|nr:hypothetical protein [Phycisphaeraceae bacterium]